MKEERRRVECLFPSRVCGSIIFGPGLGCCHKINNMRLALFYRKVATWVGLSWQLQITLLKECQLRYRNYASRGKRFGLKLLFIIF